MGEKVVCDLKDKDLRGAEQGQFYTYGQKAKDLH